ncbi:MAG: hypothetical protein ACRDRU_20420 [Pseudonocardiaceae bacterium]
MTTQLRTVVSASTISFLASIQARAHAAQGDVTACDRALGQGVEQFSSIDPATRPLWGSSLGEAHFAAFQGSAYYMLALGQPRPGRRRASGAVVAPRRGRRGP